MKHVTRSLIVLGLLAVFSLTAVRPAAAQATAVPQPVSGEMIPCPMPLPPTEIEGETIVCGQIEVPENWDDPNSRLITLTYARQLSKSLSPLPEPIIFFAGGPGGSVLAAQGSSGFDFTYLRENRDVIVWDQRGNRYSADLRCPLEVTEAAPADGQAALAELGEFDFTLQDDPQAVLDWARQFVPLAEATGQCAAYFKAAGQDVTQYNTANTVRDAIALMNHLGYPAYNLFGISYGTQVALAIADYYEKNPDAALPPIRSAVIDGVFPVNLPGAEDSLVVPHNILRIFADCEADAACGAAYPQIRQRLIDLLATLESAPLVTADGAEVTLDNVVAVLQTAVVARDAMLISYLPRLVDELTRGETATYAVAQDIIAGNIAPEGADAASTPGNLLAPVTLQAAGLAEELHAIADRLAVLGDTTGDLTAAMDEAATLSELYLNLLQRYLADGGPDERDAFANQIQSLYSLHPEQQTHQGLLALSASLPDPIGGELAAIANLLSGAEVSQVWAALTDDQALQQLKVMDLITNAVVKCNDRGHTYDVVQAWEYLKESAAPQLATPLDVTAAYQARCEGFGIPSGEYALPPAVTTDLPILVMNGGLDHATPVEWAERAFSTLTNAQLVIVPMTDHGATRYSKCAKDIANTFFLSPEVELQTSCVDAFRAQFVLPDAALPGAAK
jgi:pimeloyl-ACP methyl ester carboxylesterase